MIFCLFALSLLATCPMGAVKEDCFLKRKTNPMLFIYCRQHRPSVSESSEHSSSQPELSLSPTEQEIIQEDDEENPSEDENESNSGTSTPWRGILRKTESKINLNE